MRPPPEAKIRAPELPPRAEWLNGGPLPMSELVGARATLIEFFDVARVNSHRTLPYLRAWHERYRDRGLTVIGIHSPGYSLSADPELVAAEVERLGIDYPVLLDGDLRAWREYGNRGWPGRYLFDAAGILRWVHYGEGAYADCELAVHEALTELDPAVELPEPLEALRPEDVEGVLLAPQTADVALPAERDRLALEGEWADGVDFVEAAAPGARAAVRSFSAGGAFAVLGGRGVERPGLHETDGAVEAPAAGFRLHGFQFTPLPP